MFNWLKIKDSRGNFSWTHSLVIPIVILITLKLIFSGIDIVMSNGYHITLASMTSSDYVDTIKYWLGLFFSRETTAKVVDYLEKKNDNGGPTA